MRKEPNTTTLSSESELIHCASFGSDNSRAVKVHEVTLLGATLCLAEALDHFQVG